MTTEAHEHLARALETLATQIASCPRNVVGMNVSVSAGAGSGPVTGLSVTARGGAGSGNVTGMKVQVDAGGPDPAAGLVQEIREAAGAVRQDKGNQSWLQGLVARARSLTDRVVDAAAVASVQQAVKAVFG